MEDVKMTMYLFEQEGKEYVNVEGIAYPVQKDKNGDKFYYVDNELNYENPDDKEFTGRVKDAVETVRSGKGDVLELMQYFGNCLFVKRYVDRVKGEEYRKKSIEAWEGAEFKWVIYTISKDSFTGNYIASDYQLISEMYYDAVQPLQFESWEEANTFVKELLCKAYKYAKEISEKASNVKDVEASSNIVRSVLTKIEDETGIRHSAITKYMFDMLGEDYQLRVTEDNIVLHKYMLEIRQFVVEDVA